MPFIRQITTTGNPAGSPTVASGEQVATGAGALTIVNADGSTKWISVLAGFFAALGAISVAIFVFRFLRYRKRVYSNHWDDATPENLKTANNIFAGLGKRKGPCACAIKAGG